MRDLFTRLNQETAQLEADRNPLSKEYSTQLFKGTSWYLVAFQSGLVDVEDVPPPQTQTEKVQVLKALEVFAKEKTEKGEKTFQFEGGQLQYKNEEGRQYLSLQEDLPSSLAIYESAIESCALCPAHALSKRAMVVSELENQAPKSPLKVLFVGDYPKRIPESKDCFPGEGGALLRKMIGAMKLTAGEFAWTLALKCYRSTEDSLVFEEMGRHCLKNIYREIALLKPQVVIPLGAVAANLLLARKERMAQIHGQSFEQTIHFKNSQHQFIIVPTFHPDFLMSSPGNKKVAWEDLQKVMKMIGKM